MNVPLSPVTAAGGTEQLTLENECSAFPKSDKRVDYTARTMAAVKQLEQAAKLKK